METKEEKEVMLERYDEEKGAVRMKLSETIKKEIKAFENLLKVALNCKKASDRIEHYRRWKVSKDNDVYVRLIIEKNKD